MKQIIVDINGTPHKFDSVGGTRPLKVREILAQKIMSQTDTATNRHKVLVSQQGILFNPTEPGIQINQVDRHHTGLFVYNLRRCSKQCYDDYTAFLRSKNKIHLLIAQRRFYDES